MGMLEELYMKESYMVLSTEVHKIGYCGNVGGREPASRQNTKEIIIYMTNRKDV